MGVGPIDVGVVRLGPHLDVRNVAQARALVHAALETATGELVLDLVDLELIDAAGLGMLTAAHLRAERAGVRLVLRHCTRDVRRVLAVTRLNRLLRVERSERPVSA